MSVLIKQITKTISKTFIVYLHFVFVAVSEGGDVEETEWKKGQREREKEREREREREREC